MTEEGDGAAERRGRGPRDKTAWRIEGERGRANLLIRKDKDPHLTCQAATRSVIQMGPPSWNNLTTRQLRHRLKVTAEISIKRQKRLGGMRTWPQKGVTE